MFRPSHESLLIQNAEIDRLELPRIQDETELEALKADGSLLEIKAGETLRFDPRLDPSRRYCRPWTLNFVDDLSQAFYNRFHQQIQVNSAVRTVKVQKKLRRHNRNAAPADGDTASSHLAGVTVDLQRRGLSKEQVRWMEHYLFYMRVGVGTTVNRCTAWIKRLRLLSLLLVGFLPVIPTMEAQSADPWLIVPSGQGSVISSHTTRKDLVQAYGAANVVDQDVDVGEGETQPGTVIFPKDPERLIEILWKDPDKKTLPASAQLSGAKSRWKTAHSISLGTSLKDLERRNGRPFKLAGFGWDYSGTVTS